MIKRFLKTSIIIFIFAAISFPVLAQRSGTVTDPNNSGSAPAASSSRFNLTVNCNIRNAAVSILPNGYKDGGQTGTAPFRTQLNRGNYVVIVAAPGYAQQQQNINLTSNQTLNFNLGAAAPVKSALQIRSNVRDARVVITGAGINGQLVGSAPFTAQLAAGRYSITVSAPGYQTAFQDVNLSSAQSININLSADSYNLTVMSNVDNAKVFIRGGEINGQLTGTTEMTTVLSKGRYQVKVNAPGYFAEEQTVILDESTTINIQLRPRTGRLEIIIPNNILDYSKGNPAAQIKIFDNGSPVNGTSAQLSTGQHTIRITSGAFASQQTINVQAGESYRIELNFGFALIKE